MLRKLFGDIGRLFVGPSGNKMERFTQRTRRVLSLAQEEAEKRQHSTINTEHLLLGLLREEGSIAAAVLRELGARPESVEMVIEEFWLANETSQNPVAQEGSDDLMSVVNEMAATPAPIDLGRDTKRALELAVDEARRMGSHFIGTEHLLFALIRQEDTIAFQAMSRLGLTPTLVRERTRQILWETSKTTDGKPQSEDTTSNPLTDEVMQRLSLRLTIHESDNPTKQISIPLKQFVDEINAALKSEKRGMFLKVDIENGSVELFLDEVPPSE